MSEYTDFNGGKSKKIEVGDLKVPFREVPLTTGETFRLYDTSGRKTTTLNGTAEGGGVVRVTKQTGTPIFSDATPRG